MAKFKLKKKVKKPAPIPRVTEVHVFDVQTVNGKPTRIKTVQRIIEGTELPPELLPEVLALNRKSDFVTAVYSLHSLMGSTIDLPWRVGPVQRAVHECEPSFRARVTQYAESRPDLFYSPHAPIECEMMCTYECAVTPRKRCTPIEKCWYGHILLSDLLHLAENPVENEFPVGIGPDFIPSGMRLEDFARISANMLRRALPAGSENNLIQVYFAQPNSPYCQIRPRLGELPPIILPTSLDS